MIGTKIGSPVNEGTKIATKYPNGTKIELDRTRRVSLPKTYCKEAYNPNYSTLSRLCGSANKNTIFSFVLLNNQFEGLYLIGFSQLVYRISSTKLVHFIDHSALVKGKKSIARNLVWHCTIWNLYGLSGMKTKFYTEFVFYHFFGCLEIKCIEKMFCLFFSIENNEFCYSIVLLSEKDILQGVPGVLWSEELQPKNYRKAFRFSFEPYHAFSNILQFFLFFSPPKDSTILKEVLYCLVVGGHLRF